ncbi:hypothetical protein FB451DRAFT_1549328 [Mycena latifolia]|nr:hypothetical protein FB451DRAFT_1549328 [Mycena latifolia]
MLRSQILRVVSVVIASLAPFLAHTNPAVTRSLVQLTSTTTQHVHNLASHLPPPRLPSSATVLFERAPFVVKTFAAQVALRAFPDFCATRLHAPPRPYSAQNSTTEDYPLERIMGLGIASSVPIVATLTRTELSTMTITATLVVTVSAPACKPTFTVTEAPPSESTTSPHEPRPTAQSPRRTRNVLGLRWLVSAVLGVAVVLRVFICCFGHLTGTPSDIPLMMEVPSLIVGFIDGGHPGALDLADHADDPGALAPPLALPPAAFELDMLLDIVDEEPRPATPPPTLPLEAPLHPAAATPPRPVPTEDDPAADSEDDAPALVAEEPTAGAAFAPPTPPRARPTEERGDAVAPKGDGNSIRRLAPIPAPAPGSAGGQALRFVTTYLFSVLELL